MKSKFIKIFLSIIIVITFILTFTKRIDVIKADSGWDTDYDSGSSWDSGSDWDSGSSWDDDDYDYSSGSSSNGGVSIKCESSACQTIVLILMYGIISIFILIFTIAFVMAIIRFVTAPIRALMRLFKRKNKVNNRANTVQSKEIDMKKYERLSSNEANLIIPNFDIEEFNFKAYQIFYDIQISWMEFDYEKLKNLVTDELYNSYVMQLDALKIKNQKNVMNSFELINSHVYSLKEENGIYIAHVYLNVEFYDYIEDTKTGVMLRGNNSKKVNNTYILTFIKTKEENKVENCPRCGAPQEGNVTDTCEYCKSKLINETHDWVMSKKEKINQK